MIQDMVNIWVMAREKRFVELGETDNVALAFLQVI